MIAQASSLVEERIAETVSRFHEEQQGCLAEETRAFLVDDMVLVRSSGCYTETEKRLSQTDEGRKLIKSARRDLRSLTRRDIEARVAEVVGRKVLRSYWDLDVRLGEQVEVYILGEPMASLA